MNGWQGLFSVPGVPSPGSLGNINTGPGGWPGFGNTNVGSPSVALPYMTPTGGQETMFSPHMLGGNFRPLSTSVATGATTPRGWFGIDGLGANLGTLQLGLGTLGGFANIWNGMQQNKLAKQSFNHQKGLLDTNLANQIKAFNLQLDDKLRSRQVVEGTSDASREEARRRWEARDERRG